MAKRTAVIDIGSNSVRVVVYEKTSRYGFHILYETKSKARISEGAYLNNGFLQEIPMQRTFLALKEFTKVIKNLKCKKTLCVATSALRDAPNKNIFINRVKKELKLSIKIIDGEKEAYLGAIAANNLLYPQKKAVTVDIGGGSTEFALIKDRKIVKLFSLKLGTVRIKELFSNGKDGKIDMERAKEHIENELKKLPKDFLCETVLGIGGSIRTLSKVVMPEDYPIDSLHGFEYEAEENLPIFKKIYKSKITELKKFKIKKERYDTIREGALIFSEILKYLQTDKVITSGAGIREGVYLSDLLRNANHRFPANFNPDIRSLIDRFSLFQKNDAFAANLAKKLFTTLIPLHKLEKRYEELLAISAKLSSIGSKIDFFSNNHHSFYLILNGLNYGISHKEKALIALIVKYQGKKLLSKKDLKFYSPLLPKEKTLNTLSFILALSKCLTKTMQKTEILFELKDKTLFIKSPEELFLSKECVKKLENPFDLKIEFETLK